MPLYFVVAAGAVAFIVTTLRGRAPPGTADSTPRDGPIRWLEWLLAGYVVLYALQAAYSPKFTTALQQVVFFYVPFALAYCLLRRLDWTQRLTRTCLALLAGLAVLFALVGFVEYETKTIFLNPKLIAANQLHAYFTVNSVFFDPNIFGRFLALVMILLAAVILYARRQRTVLITGAVLAILWVALLLTLSRSAIGALLVGLGTLAAVRWRVGRAVFIAAGVVALVAAVIAITPTTFGLNQGINGASSGRPGLVTGGLDLFKQRPLWGYGSGSFETEFAARHHAIGETTVGLAHDPGDDRGRAGADRRGRLRRARARGAVRAVQAVPLRSRARGDRRGVPRAAVPHAAVRGLPRGPDHVDAAGDRIRARGAAAVGLRREEK